MSGMARLGPVIPGSVATFIASSSERLRRIVASRDSYAYTMTSVRMPRRSSRRIRCRHASTRSIAISCGISDVQVNFRHPAVRSRGYAQLVPGDRLDDEFRAVTGLAPANRLNARGLERDHAELAEPHPLAVKPVQDLAQPRHQQRFVIAPAGLERVLLPPFHAAGLVRDREQRQRGIREQLRQRA